MAQRFSVFIGDRFKRSIFTGLPLTILVVLAVVLTLSAVGLTDAVVESDAIVRVDASFTQFLFQHRSAALVGNLEFITQWANPITILILTTIAAAYLLLKRQHAHLFALLLSVIGSQLTVSLLKIAVNRSRPDASIALFIEDTKSFPSGHSAMSVAFFGFIMYYVMRELTPHKQTRLPIYLLGILLIGTIGFSRIYLGVHYLSDVLSGFIIGGLWLVLSITLHEHDLYMRSFLTHIDS